MIKQKDIKSWQVLWANNDPIIAHNTKHIVAYTAL